VPTVGKVCKTNCNPYGVKEKEFAAWVNWEKQEQAFKSWNKMQDSARKMSPAKFRFMCQMDVYYSVIT
jgi:hypothetical protein